MQITREVHFPDPESRPPRSSIITALSEYIHYSKRFSRPQKTRFKLDTDGSNQRDKTRKKFRSSGLTRFRGLSLCFVAKLRGRKLAGALTERTSRVRTGALSFRAFLPLVTKANKKAQGAHARARNFRHIVAVNFLLRACRLCREFCLIDGCETRPWSRSRPIRLPRRGGSYFAPFSFLGMQ